MSGDGSCSGPNPFKTLTDHVNRDQSLRQDRLVGINQNQGSFRSQNQTIGQSQGHYDAFMNQGPVLPDQQAPLLEPGFQNRAMPGQNLQNQMQAQNHHSQASQSPHTAHFINHQVHPTARPSSTPAAGGANWAAEFAAMNARGQTPVQQTGPRTISQPFPMQHHFGMMNRPAMPNTFMSAPTQAPTIQQGSNNATFSPLYDPANRQVDAQTGAAIRKDADQDFADEMDAWMSANGTNGFTAKDMAGIDAELEAVAREFGQEDAGATTKAPVEDPEAIMTQIADQQDATRAADEITARLTEQLNLAESQPEAVLTDLGRNELGSLAQSEQDTAAAAAGEQAPEYSEIADAAARLIDSVQHETGQKWANSSFLKLMREFRDGDKVVEDGVVKEAAKHDTNGDGAPQGGGSGTAV